MILRCIKVAAAGIVLAAAVGCCPCVKPGAVLPLPKPISIEQQLGLLNARARALPFMTIRGTVVIRYTDKNGAEKQSADGELLIRQRYGEAGARDAGDVCLLGTVMDQEVFQAGKNQEKWWFIVRVDQKTAWVGDVQSAGERGGRLKMENQKPKIENGGAVGGADFEGGAGAKTGDDASGGGGGVMRADVVLQMLGITEILPRVGATVAMTVSDADRSNHVLIIREGAAGLGWVRREIVVDRDTGNVRRVNLYDPSGVLLVEADLADYRRIGYRDGDEVPAGFKPVAFPHDILITYEAERASVHLTIPGVLGKQAEVRDHLPGGIFRTPDFAGQGLRVIEN